MALGGRAMCYVELDRAEEAIPDLEFVAAARSCATGKIKLDAFCDLADVYSTVGRDYDAVKYYQKALSQSTEKNELSILRRLIQNVQNIVDQSTDPDTKTRNQSYIFDILMQMLEHSISPRYDHDEYVYWVLCYLTEGNDYVHLEESNLSEFIRRLPSVLKYMSDNEKYNESTVVKVFEIVCGWTLETPFW